MKNRMFMRCAILITSIPMIIGCSSTKQYYRDDFIVLNNTLEGKYNNKQHRLLPGSTNQMSITDLLDIKTSDSIVQFKTINNRLVVSCTNESGILKHYSYSGDFKKKHFELYLKYETFAVPVLLSCSKNSKRLSFSILGDNSLVINYQYVNEGMLLLFGAGNSFGAELNYQPLQ